MNGTCRSSSFVALAGTHLANTVLDNLFKTVVSFHALHVLPDHGEATRFVSLVTILFIFPFIAFSHVGGFLADRFPKRKVILVLFGIKVLLTLAATGLLFLGELYSLGLMVALIEVNTALYIPSRLSLLTDMLDEKELSRGTGYIQMASLLGVVLGTMAAGILFERHRDQVHHIGFIMTGLMALATLGCLWIKSERTTPARQNQKLLAELASASTGLGRHRGLLAALLILTFFNIIGAVFQTNILVWGSYVLRVTESRMGYLMLSLSLGLAAGSVGAGVASGGKINLKLIPWGGLGIALTTLLLGVSTNFFFVLGVLFLLGFSGGFFSVPPQAYYQYHSPDAERGMYISILEIVMAAGFFIGGGFLWLLGGKLGVGADRVFIVISALTLLTTARLFFGKASNGARP